MARGKHTNAAKVRSRLKGTWQMKLHVLAVVGSGCNHASISCRRCLCESESLKVLGAYWRKFCRYVLPEHTGH